MMKIKLNDRVLTAYVLDELSPRKQRAVERALETDQTARRIVQELAATVKITGEAFKEAPVIAYVLTPEQRERLKARIGEIEKLAPELASAPPGVLKGRDYRRVMKWSTIAASMVLLVVMVGGVAFLFLPSLNVDICWIVGKQYIESTESDGKGAVLYCRAPSMEEEIVLGQKFACEPIGRMHFGGDGDVPAPGDYDGYGNGRYEIAALSEVDRDKLRTLGYIGGKLDWRDDPEKVYWPGHDTEAYDNIVDNPFLKVTQNPLSTFSIDVDTASYANARRFLNNGNLPPKDAVRIEEMVNYFSYDYVPPAGEVPFSADVEVAGCPWNPEDRLVRIGLKGWELPEEERPPSNLVFLLDVSGSMSPENKLPLLKRAMKMLVKQLNENDRVAIVVYAGASGLVLPSTTGDNQESLRDALERLESGGSTNGGAGIQLAYDTAAQYFIEGGVNRVILATDGDFNVGVTNRGDLIRLIEEKAKSGVFLTVLGFGMGNIKDSALEQLADKGNGNYAYIDTIREAKKVLVEEMGSTLITIAKDVKIQVEFNPAEVASYRLIGYENRILRDEDFNDDTKDAGEIGAGHTVTALYEIVPAGREIDLPDVDPLKYQRPAGTAGPAASGELLTLKLRYKEPDGDKSRLLEFPVVDVGKTFKDADADFAFAAAVASFGMLLRDSEHRGNATFSTVLDLAEAGRGEDTHGYRAEFIDLVKKAAALRR